MKKVYTQNGEFIINECLYESIMKNNPELLIERTLDDDVKNFNNNVKDILDDINKIFYQNYKKRLTDKQYHRLKDYLETFKEIHNDKELEYRPNHKKIQDMLTSMVLGGESRAYLVDLLLSHASGDSSFNDVDLTKIKTNYKIIDTQLAINDNVPNSVKKKFGLRNTDLVNKFFQSKPEDFVSAEEIKNSLPKETQEKIDDLKKQKEEYEKRNKQRELEDELASYESKVLKPLTKLSESVVARCKHVVKSSTGIWGGDNAKLILGGFNFKKLSSVETSLPIKYYLGAMEENKNEYFGPIRDLFFEMKASNDIKKISNDDLKNDSDDGRKQVRTKLAKDIKQDIYDCCYLMEINNNYVNDIYRAMYLDDVLGSKFHIKTISKEVVLNATERVMTFNYNMDGKEEIACIIVIRPIFQRLSKLIPQIKDNITSLGSINAM